MSALALLGSARPDGDAARLLRAVCAGRAVTCVDLGALRIADYTYGSAPADDFSGVVDLVLDADAVLLVTPVYWYAMSGVLKRFLDRWTELVTVRTARGRALAGRGLFVAACGSEARPPEGFEVPFRRTADYVGMVYGGLLYARTADGELYLDAAQVEAFGEALTASPPGP